MKNILKMFYLGDVIEIYHEEEEFSRLLLEVSPKLKVLLQNTYNTQKAYTHKTYIHKTYIHKTYTHKT